MSHAFNRRRFGTGVVAALSAAAMPQLINTPAAWATDGPRPADASTGLVVDDFGEGAAERWTVTAAGGSEPELGFDGEMMINWSGAVDALTASRPVEGQDWSGYRRLQLSLRPRDLAYRPVLRLTAADGTDFSVELSPHNSSSDQERTLVEVDLTSAAQPLLSRIARLDIEISPRRSPGGTLQLTSITLTDSRGFFGPTAFVDPSLATYDYPELDWEVVAGRIHDQGFTAAHLIVLNFENEYADAVEALRGIGLKVGLTIYPTTNFEAYEKHPEWQQESLAGGGKFDWRVYLSPTHPDFLSWLHSELERLMITYSFDALSLNEPWFEVWGGPYLDNPERAHYMDISDSARDAFQQQHDYDPLTTLFLRDSDDCYYLDPQMEDSPEYAAWVQFRIDTLNTFMADLAATARGVKPDLDVFLTYMADVRIPGAAGKAPEYQAQDLDSMQTAVQPQGVIFETAWQDWLQPDLTPDYVLDYTEAYVPALHDGVAGLGQPDIGSVVMRDFDWVKDFSGYCSTGGFSGYAIYEWSIGDWETGGLPLPRNTAASGRERLQRRR